MQLFLCQRTGRLVWVPDYRVGSFTRSASHKALSEPVDDPDNVVVAWCRGENDEPEPRRWCCSFHAWRAMPDAVRQEHERQAVLRTLMSHGLTF